MADLGDLKYRLQNLGVEVAPSFFASGAGLPPSYAPASPRAYRTVSRWVWRSQGRARVGRLRGRDRGPVRAGR